jgi:hypothetical protein
MSDPGTVAITIGGQVYIKPLDRTCPICVSPVLLQVDTLLSYGWTYERVRSAMRGYGVRGATSDELKAHIAHLAAPHAEARRELEEAVTGRGGTVEDGSSPVELEDVARLSLQRVYERIQSGDAEIAPRDAVALIKLYREIAREESGREAASSIAQWEAAAREILWIARRHLGTQWKAFVADLRASETLRAIMPPDPAEEPVERTADRTL